MRGITGNNPNIRLMKDLSFKERRTLAVEELKNKSTFDRKSRADAINEIHNINRRILDLDIDITKLFHNKEFATINKKKQGIEKEIRKLEDKVKRLKKEHLIN